MKTWEIWMEGYACTGHESGAELVGTAEGETFRDAVFAHYAANPNPDFNSGQLTVWGCRLFDNEAAARKSFG